MSFREYRQKILRFVGNYLLYGAVTAVCKTLHIHSVNREKTDELFLQKKNFIIAFWHGSMLVPWYVYRNKGFAALVSKSKDGALLDRVLTQWNYSVIRGSSHNGGSVALSAMLDLAQNKKMPIAITPDGPRGPYHKAKAGAVITAKKAQVPLVLLGVGYGSKKELKSWDKFEIPLPFSKVNLIYSDPICIDAELNYDETALVLENCEIRLNELYREANNF
ncbi:MAG: lysophospholipid acyltransferase family protein [Ignavibacteriales bacterium]